jgi:tripartite-type tricarboxylate transporter receptor subunit TctC
MFVSSRGSACAIAIALAGAPLGLVGAKAESAADFYKGKELVVYVGSGVGGGYDNYTRLLARHWGRHIPGNPSLVVKNMPGAQGTVMMNYLAVKGKTDGTEIGSPFGQSLIEPVFDKGRVTKYDPRKLQWIGSISSQSIGCFTWRARSSVKTIEDAKARQTIMASTGAINPTSIYANILNQTMGTKFKVVSGYSTSEATLVIERGEADGSCLSYATLVTEHPDWTAEKKVNWLIVFADKPDPNLPGVPTTAQYLTSGDDRLVNDVLISQLEMGRPFVAPEGAPADRVEALRTSFMETMKDPQYLAEAKKAHQIIAPADHTQMEKLIARTYAVPERIIARTAALLKGEAKAPAKK